MAQTLGLVTLLVNDYDEAIDWFTRIAGFCLREDTPQGSGKRWVVVTPPGSDGAGLLLARAVGAEQAAAVGRQGGGRVLLFLHTDDFHADHARMVQAGVRFREAPREEPYATVAVFEDLYGNPWDLLQPK
ncbi:VOC family protein [Dyella sp.]|jgi:catechol 2,3-dioxygenase-like lactoylglutathione lyase family enzyme|uniref:VOC family protein n=1 Tax=Dyella sp. TaxID=1869338 RepID=UPI002D7991C9|nr:VOC family protein [Dyella sp.]HET6432205.1 VOC family protein [Dyella sp.]